MIESLYFLVIIIVAFLSVVTGFRRGLTSQVASLLGVAFGAVAARVLYPEFSQNFQFAARFSQSPEFDEFSINLITCVVIYFVVYWLFAILSVVLGRALAVIEKGIVNRIVGACFTLLKNLIWVSIIYNLLLCFSSSSGLLKFEQSDDGNLVAAVMRLTPAVLGCYGPDDFALFHQLKDAKSISRNFKPIQML